MSNREMFINYARGEECRIAIMEEGLLQEFYQERASSESHVGNIYKGRVTNVEPSIQAAFVDFGLERNGFLHISDLHPMYFPGQAKEESERVGMRTPRRERPLIQKCLHRGQEVLVQVLKEGIGTKGPTLTSYLSIPGRFIVMMPFMERLGVSRKIEDDDLRRQMREMLDDLSPPDGFGFIIRTAGMDRTKAELKRDLAYLQRLWKSIERRRSQTNIGELYTESDLIIRTIRDVYSSDITRIIVDDAQAAKRAHDFLTIASPRSGSTVLYYNDPVPLFHRYDVEAQIENIHAKIVPLPSGGSLVIEATEALVAIDVNSGKMRDNRDAETTAYKTNVEAADEICRQLRLRDLGGVVVCDLIDMRHIKHRRAIEGQFRDNLKRDRARTRTLPLSQFGILEMTRQRMRASLISSISTNCPHCVGSGRVRSAESVVLDVMRRLAMVMVRSQVARIELTVSPDVAFQLLNRRRGQLVALERKHDKPVMVRVQSAGGMDKVDLVAFDERGGAVNVESNVSLPDAVLETVTGPLDQEFADLASEGDEVSGESPEAAEGRGRKPRRRRSGRGRGKAETAEAHPVAEQPAKKTAQAPAAPESDEEQTPVAEREQAESATTEETSGEPSHVAWDLDDPDMEIEAGHTIGARPVEPGEEDDDSAGDTPSDAKEEGSEQRRGRRRRRGGRGRSRRRSGDQQADQSGESPKASSSEQKPPAQPKQAASQQTSSSDQASPERRGRRRRRRGRGGSGGSGGSGGEGRQDSHGSQQPQGQSAHPPKPSEPSRPKPQAQVPRPEPKPAPSAGGSAQSSQSPAPQAATGGSAPRPSSPISHKQRLGKRPAMVAARDGVHTPAPAIPGGPRPAPVGSAGHTQPSRGYRNANHASRDSDDAGA
ncbi:MAG: Rne/Rng family ribonuclease [Phycisphaeraceae bacterium]|nr:Rne/Rng family ribonuclease [Phycisphaeraceae bacterium]